MSPPAPPRRPGRPPSPPPAPVTDVDVAARLDAIIERGIGAIETEMDVMLEPLPGGGVGHDAVDRVVELTEKAATISGHVRRNRAEAARRKLTLPMIEKAIADLTPDERAHLRDRLSNEGSGRNVLG